MKYAIISDIHGNLEALQSVLTGSRDNNPKAAYAIYDRGAGTIELRRVDYDIEKTRQKMRAAGL